MEEQVTLVHDAFQKNSDGSWTCIKNTDIKHDGLLRDILSHRVSPGFVFRKSKTQWGIDVVGILEKGA